MPARRKPTKASPTVEIPPAEGDRRAPQPQPQPSPPPPAAPPAMESLEAEVLRVREEAALRWAQRVRRAEDALAAAQAQVQAQQQQLEALQAERDALQRSHDALCERGHHRQVLADVEELGAATALEAVVVEREAREAELAEARAGLAAAADALARTQAERDALQAQAAGLAQAAAQARATAEETQATLETERRATIAARQVSEAEIQSREIALKRLRESLEVVRAESAGVRGELRQQASENAAALVQAQREHGEALARLQHEHVKALAEQQQALGLAHADSIAALRQEHAAAIAALAREHARVKDALQHEQGEARERSQALQQQAEAAWQARLFELQARCERADAEIAELQQQRGQQAEAAARSLADREARLAALADSADRLRADLQQAEERHRAERAADAEAHARQQASLQAHFEQARTAAEQAQEQLRGAMQARLAELEARLEEALASAAARMQEAEATRQAAERERAALTAQLDASRAAHADERQRLQAQASQLQEALADGRRELEQSHRRLQQHRQDFARRLQYAARTHEAAQLGLREALSRARQLLQEVCGRLEAQVSVLDLAPPWERTPAGRTQQALRDVQARLRQAAQGLALPAPDAPAPGAPVAPGLAALMAMDDGAFLRAAGAALLPHGPEPALLQQLGQRLAQGEPRLRLLDELRRARGGAAAAAPAAALEALLDAWVEAQRSKWPGSHRGALQKLLDEAMQAPAPVADMARTWHALEQVREALRDLDADAVPPAPEGVLVVTEGQALPATGAAEWVCLLAPGAVPRADALATLRRSFELFPGAGLVGAAAVGPDGRLLHAGLEVGPEGQTRAPAHGATPGGAGWRHARETDACGPGALMIPVLLLEALGAEVLQGPPGSAAPALSAALRARGYRVLTQPLALVDLPAALPGVPGPAWPPAAWQEGRARAPRPPQLLFLIDPPQDADPSPQALQRLNLLLLARDLGFLPTLLGRPEAAASAVLAWAGVEVASPVEPGPPVGVVVCDGPPDAASADRWPGVPRIGVPLAGGADAPCAIVDDPAAAAASLSAALKDAGVAVPGTAYRTRFLRVPLD